MRFAFLADHPDAIDDIAGWYFDEWGHLGSATSSREVADRLCTYLNRDQVPLMVIAMDGGEVIAAAQLKFHEMEIYPDKEHWLGGVYVRGTHRGKGIASAIVTGTLRIARFLGVRKLHLQTEALNGGLYARLGWTASEQVNYRGRRVLVMEHEPGWGRRGKGNLIQRSPVSRPPFRDATRPLGR